MSTTGEMRDRKTQTRQRVVAFHLAMRIVRKDIKGWSQKTLAQKATEVAREETGDPTQTVSLAMVAMIELGDRNPSLEMAGWLAKALGYEVEQLGVIREPVAS